MTNRDAPSRADQDADVVRLARYIEAHADEPLTLAHLAAVFGRSPGRTQRAFSAVFGVSPKAYHDAVRAERFKAGLKAGEGVAGAGYDAGYGSTSRMARAASRLAMAPSCYARGAPGETIGYTFASTPFGRMIMAATARGVCAVQFAAGADWPPGLDHTATEDRLRAGLAVEFPKAVLVPAEDAADPAVSHQLHAWNAALASHLQDGGPRPDLPLDLRGTAFQERVWRFLTAIPPGEVLSYSQLAAGLGAPRAVRAVASACARNRIAILVPCHLVLRADGSLGGYRWGLAMKRALVAAHEVGARSLFEGQE